ncbi:MAG: ATP-binding protein [Thermodesulfobacteriota bacterium]
MVHRSIRIKLYIILALLGVIFVLFFINYLAGKKVENLDRTYSRIVVLDKELSHHISRESLIFSQPSESGNLKRQHKQLELSCLSCHSSRTDLLSQRSFMLNRISENIQSTQQVEKVVTSHLNKLTDSVSYIHEHHVTTLTNLLTRNKERYESDLSGNSFIKSSSQSAPELDIIRQTVNLQHQLAVLLGNFYSLHNVATPHELQEEFKGHITTFFKTVNTLEDYSLDAQDGLLVEELLESGRVFDELFTSLIDFEKEHRELGKQLQDNQQELTDALAGVEKKMLNNLSLLKKRISMLEKGSFIFIVLLLLLAIIRSREILQSLNRIVTETNRIQGDLSYRIPATPAAAEFQVVYDALNDMTANIDSQTQELQKEITVRTEAEHALITEKERLAVTLRSIGDGVITTNIEGKILLLNRVAEELTGWSSTEAAGKTLGEVFKLINEKSGESFGDPASRILKSSQAVGLTGYSTLIARDGTLKSIADSGAPIRDRDDRFVGVVFVFRDVSREKEIEEELIKVRKLESVGVLAGGIAHDFNNILSAILGNIELAAVQVGAHSDTAELLSKACKATRRASKLTQQLLTFSKGGNPVKETTSLPRLIRESADFVLHGANVSCHYLFDDDLGMVDVDSGQFSQVIQNIIMNSKDAMPEGGRITIHCENVDGTDPETILHTGENNQVRITIQDTGTGIPETIIDKVFDPYFSTKLEGNGLGLAICYSIINKHDGHISVHSGTDGGTIFTIYLPAVPAYKISEPDRKESSPEVKPTRIMVMDDDDMVREVLHAQLTSLGHETVLVVNGEEAVKVYRELQEAGTPADIVIMDLTIPGGMGGKEAASHILQLDPEARLIVASGYSNDPIMANFKEYGFAAAVAKPFDLNELESCVVSVLG